MYWIDKLGQYDQSVQKWPAVLLHTETFSLLLQYNEHILHHNINLLFYLIQHNTGLQNISLMVLRLTGGTSLAEKYPLEYILTAKAG